MTKMVRGFRSSLPVFIEVSGSKFLFATPRLKMDTNRLHAQKRSPGTSWSPNLVHELMQHANAGSSTQNMFQTPSVFTKVLKRLFGVTVILF
jgi:hypothetical protein